MPSYPCSFLDSDPMPRTIIADGPDEAARVFVRDAGSTPGLRSVRAGVRTFSAWVSMTVRIDGAVSSVEGSAFVEWAAQAARPFTLAAMLAAISVPDTYSNRRLAMHSIRDAGFVSKRQRYPGGYRDVWYRRD